MLKQFANFLLRKRSHAAIIALACGILPAIFASFSVVIVALITLCKGAKEGAIIAIWAIIPFFAHAYVDQSITMLAMAIVGFWGVWALALLLRATHSWVLVIQVCAIVGVAVILLAHGLHPNLADWWAAKIQRYVQVAEESAGLGLSATELEKQVHAIASLATGFEVSVIGLLAALKLLFARWWQSIAFNPGGLRKELHNIRLGYACSILFIVLVIAAYFTRSMVLVEATFPLGLALIAAGLSVLHYWLRNYKYALIALMGMYIVMIIFPKLLLIIALVGMIDSSFNLRKKMSS